jgi:hypothetical protein
MPAFPRPPRTSPPRARPRLTSAQAARDEGYCGVQALRICQPDHDLAAVMREMCRLLGAIVATETPERLRMVLNAAWPWTRVLPIDDRIELAAEVGWTELCASQRNSCADLFDRLTADPAHVDNPEKQHRLKGTLSTATVVGVDDDQWQDELGKGARVWNVIDHAATPVFLTNVATARPNQTK